MDTTTDKDSNVLADTATSGDSTASDASADTGSDTGSDTGTDANDAIVPDVGIDIGQDTSGTAVECCPLDPPGCDCVHTGGTKGPQGCMTICDAAPVGWKKGVDSNGCAYWQPGPQSCMVVPVKCDQSPISFPSFTKVCAQDAECGFVVHQTDCCGNTTAVGAWIEVVPAFTSAEADCRNQYPVCKCPQGPTKAEIGEATFDSVIEVHCVKGQCLTSVPSVP